MKLSNFHPKLSQKGLILIAVPLAFELVCFGALFSALEGAELQIRQELHATEVSQHFNAIIKLLMDAMSAAYRSGLANSGNEDLKFHDAIKQMYVEFDSLAPLLKDDPERAKGLAGVKIGIERVLAYLDEGRRSASSGDFMLAGRYLRDIRQLSEVITTHLEKLAAPYQQLADASVKTQQHARQVLKMVLFLAIISSVLLALGLYAYFNRDTMVRLNVLMDNARRFGRSEELLPEIQGSDELATLDRLFHEMAAALTKAAREKQSFMHDIRSPLTAMIGFLSMLSQDRYEGVVLSQMARDSLGRARKSADQLMKLVNDLLELDKLEAGMMKMTFEKISIVNVLNNATQALSAIAEEKGIVVALPSADFEAYADADRMVQVVINLLSNSLKYSPKQGAINIAVEQQDNFAKVLITDHGPGIPPDYLSHMFQRFHQVDTADRKKYGGTGLGLAICKEIIERHGGQIGVESELNKGTTFWFTVPETAEAIERKTRMPAS